MNHVHFGGVRPVAWNRDIHPNLEERRRLGMEYQTMIIEHNPLVTTRLRYDSTLFGKHGNAATPAVWVKKIDTGIKLIPGIALQGVVLCENGLRFAIAQGRSMPTSRGSPPIYDD